METLTAPQRKKLRHFIFKGTQVPPNIAHFGINKYLTLTSSQALKADEEDGRSRDREDEEQFSDNLSHQNAQDMFVNTFLADINGRIVRLYLLVDAFRIIENRKG